jgi:hypothetical protein
MKTCEVKIWVIVDADGVYRVGTCAQEAADTYDADFNRSLDCPTRMVKVVLVVPLPSVPTLTGTVPAEGDAVLAVA